MPSVLFICSANRFRSPLAAAFFAKFIDRSENPEIWSVGSAGTWTEAGFPPEPWAIQDAKELGFDIQGHRSRQVSAKMLSQSDLILVMEAGQKEALQIEFPGESHKIYLLSEVTAGIKYDIPDPIILQQVSHQEVSKELFELIKQGFTEICTLALNLQTASR